MNYEKFLRQCFDEAQCDKGFKHHYEKIYAPLFEELLTAAPGQSQSRIFSMLEIGIFKGASLKSWETLLRANIQQNEQYRIVAIDSFERVTPDKLGILANENVSWFETDSTDPSKIPFEKLTTRFDIIIDDGQHTPEANRKTFENYFPFLKRGGYYVVEDVWPLDVMKEEDISHWWIERFAEDYTMKKYEDFLDSFCLLKDVEIIEHDLRHETKQPDSYIITIKKK